MHKKRALGVVAAAITAVVLTAVPASAYWITGWQTNNGWNDIDGCNVWRVRGTQGVSAEDFTCARDVGVRGKGNTFEIVTITWGSHYAIQQDPPDLFTAMKVYHGDH